VTRIRFYKMTGSGNDFVVVDARAQPVSAWTPERIAAACDRRQGIGADGLVALAAEDGGVRMDYWNADGSRAAMCGNAALCSARLAVHLGMAPATGIRLLTDAGVVESRCFSGDDMAEIRLPDASVPLPAPAIARGAGEQSIWLGTVGVPHLVVLVDDVGRVDVAGRGRELRNHGATGPGGANANFIAPPQPGGAQWLIRTFERGVEGETFACGTGAVAAGLALAAHCGIALPIVFRSRGGGVLTVRATLQGKRGTDVWLGGQGRLVFAGDWEG
jgi:diaminopimelate epimerase